jgi:hypothetical protein
MTCREQALRAAAARISLRLRVMNVMHEVSARLVHVTLARGTGPLVPREIVGEVAAIVGVQLTVERSPWIRLPSATALPIF